MRPLLTILILAVWATIAEAQTQTVTLTLRFQDNANSEVGFELERCAGVSCTNFVKVKDLPINAPVAPSQVEYKDVIANDKGGTTYCYRVRAVNTAGVTAYSNTACGVSAVIITIPPAPSNLTIPSITTSSVDLRWRNESPMLTANRIEARRSGQSYSAIATLAGSTESVNVQGLRKNSTYTFRVRSCLESNCSEYANFPAVKTLR